MAGGRVVSCPVCQGLVEMLWGPLGSQMDFVFPWAGLWASLQRKSDYKKQVKLHAVARSSESSEGTDMARLDSGALGNGRDWHSQPHVPDHLWGQEVRPKAAPGGKVRKCGPKSSPLPAELTELRAGTRNLYPDAGGRTEGNSSPGPLRGPTPGAQLCWETGQYCAAAAPQAETGLGAWRLRPRPAWSCGPATPGRQRGALGAPDPSLPGGRASQCGTRITAKAPQARTAGQGTAPGWCPKLPHRLGPTRPGPGGASRRDLYHFPGLPLRPDNSSDTQSRWRVDPPIQNQPTNQTTSPKPGRFPSAADLIRAALPA
ncbi:uncharacterized protein LOC115896350 [Rhinopithecus roxellana]|uniref:uncharacterized protein LOC115896350 n=1 Tax=Rhinopithecus roxellana TaxID=61622 RepID=UPI001237101B|nr:uncharacterized protein LOC115896350 [Rhinopithecus roxellana]